MLQKFTIKIYDVLTFEFVASCRGEKILGVACLSNLQIEPYGTPRQFSLEKKKEELKKKKKKKKAKHVSVFDIVLK